jgi:opacity protein-like surface antigen
MASYDIGGAVGLIDYRPHRWVWPYVFAGIGGVTYDLSQTVDPPLGVFIQRAPSGGQNQIVLARDRTDVIAIDELGLESKLAFNIGLGTDFRIPLGAAGVGLRFEASDSIHESPLNIRITDVNAVSQGRDGLVNFGAVHNLRASAGIVLQFGR